MPGVRSVLKKRAVYNHGYTAAQMLGGHYDFLRFSPTSSFVT